MLGLTTVFGQGYDTLIAEVLPLLDLLELNGEQTLVNKDDPADAQAIIWEFGILVIDQNW